MAVIAASVAGAVACGASVVCGVAVGVAAGAASYAVAKGGTKQFSVKGMAGSAVIGGALGGASGALSKIALPKAGQILANKYNGGLSRVVIPNRAGRTFYDLTGKAHFEKAANKSIPTPHQFLQKLNPKNPGSGYGNKSPVTRTNLYGLYKVMKFLRR